MIKKGASLDDLEKISKINIKNPKKYFKELEKFSKPEPIPIDDKITINLIAGDTEKGLTHIWLRHIMGYESNEKATSFFPMGQTVNGKKLPKIIDDANELKEIIKKAIDENKKEFFKDKNDNPKIRYNYTKNGKIIEIVLMFKKDKTGAYNLMTMYPEKGEGVYMYAPKKPNEKWKTWKRNDNGELVETWTN